MIRLGIQANSGILDAVQPVSLQTLQKMRAVGGAQSRSSKISALVPTYQTRFRLAGYEHDLLQVHLFQRLRNDLTISSNPPQVLPKGFKLLQLPRLTTWTRGMTDLCSRKFSGSVHLLEIICPTFADMGYSLGARAIC